MSSTDFIIQMVDVYNLAFSSVFVYHTYRLYQCISESWYKETKHKETETKHKEIETEHKPTRSLDELKFVVSPEYVVKDEILYFKSKYGLTKIYLTHIREISLTHRSIDIRNDHGHCQNNVFIDYYPDFSNEENHIILGDILKNICDIFQKHTFDNINNTENKTENNNEFCVLSE